MELRLVVFIFLFSSNLTGMDLLPENFLPAAEPHKRCLLKFIDSDPLTITNNMRELFALVANQPFKKDPGIQEPLNKALSVLITFWSPEFEANGLKMAQILVEAGADPRASVCINENNSWGVRSSQTMFKSTVYDEARGQLKVYLQKSATKSAS
jgi:hypothetical protein